MRGVLSLFAVLILSTSMLAVTPETADAGHIAPPGGGYWVTTTQHHYFGPYCDSPGAYSYYRHETRVYYWHYWWDHTYQMWRRWNLPHHYHLIHGPHKHWTNWRCG